MRLPVFDANGNRTQEILEVDEKIFGEKVREALLKEVVLMHEARKRVGTHSTKGRADCAGSGRKLWRQKGTGRARVGRARAPHWRGGGVAFGPKPRDYGYSVPKKAKKVAINSAWLAKLQSKNILVFEDFGIEEPKTAKMFSLLKSLGIEDSRVAIALDRPGKDDEEKQNKNETLWKSVRNLPKVSMDEISRFSVYTLLSHDKIVVTKKALDDLVTSREGTVTTLKRDEVYKKS